MPLTSSAPSPSSRRRPGSQDKKSRRISRRPQPSLGRRGVGLGDEKNEAGEGAGRMIYAEVIGDPVAQSRSPALHKAWLAACGLEGDYRATHVLPEDLPAYIAARRADPDWRGCNVTVPHKQAVIPLLD